LPGTCENGGDNQIAALIKSANISAKVESMVAIFIGFALPPGVRS
jgi:hypothetical protein